MIVGIGLDIVEMDRMKDIMERRSNIIDRILSFREKEIFNKLRDSRQLEFLAGRFAAKEAFSKALGTGIGKTVGFLDIEILHDEKGKPIIVQNITSDRVFVTITHSKNFAAAQVIIESMSS